MEKTVAERPAFCYTIKIELRRGCRTESGGNGMEIGVIGLGRDGMAALDSLLDKTVHNLCVYDPDGRACHRAVTVCRTAAELCDRCGIVILALERASDLTALCNGIAGFLREGQLFIDLTDTSPALAHTVANGMRRRGARYLDCGIFGTDGLRAPFILFAGGSGEAFAAAQPIIRCFAPDCRYLGPAGRGRAGRLFCRALTARLQDCVQESAASAELFGIDPDYFLDSLGRFAEIADPLGALGGGEPTFSPRELARDAALVREMERRAVSVRRSAAQRAARREDKRPRR